MTYERIVRQLELARRCTTRPRALGAQLQGDRNNHYYEMWDTSNGGNDTYNYYVDGSLVHQSQKQLESSMDNWQVGIELFSGDGGETDNSNMSTGDRFHNYIQDYRNSVGSWNYVNMDSATSNNDGDGACGLTDNCVMNPCSTFGNAICFVGGRTSDYEWSDYKPG